MYDIMILIRRIAFMFITPSEFIPVKLDLHVKVLVTNGYYLLV